MNFCILSSVSVTPPRDLGTITEKMQKISPERRQKYAQSNKFSQLDKIFKIHFLSNKNSKKEVSSRSRRDVPKSEERVEKFVDSDENEPFENRDFFIKNLLPFH